MDNIPRCIPIQFVQPPFAPIRGGCAISTTLMSMPKATMHEKHSLIFCQDNIWPPRQLFSMKSKPESHPLQCRPNSFLRGRVHAPNPAHVPASPFLC